VLIIGGAGVGKTRLMQAAGELAATLGIRLLNARASEVEREFDYGVVCQLLEPPLRALGRAGAERVLSGAASRARTVLGIDGGELAPGSEGATLHSLYWLAVNLSLQAPLLIVVDDLHWSDSASVKWIRYLARRVVGLRIGIVAATRSPEPGSSGLVAVLSG
jgi:hypothetical protein